MKNNLDNAFNITPTEVEVDESDVVVGVDRAKMRLYDVEESAQNLTDDSPVMDTTHFGERQDEDDNMQWRTKSHGRRDFSKLFAT